MSSSVDTAAGTADVTSAHATIPDGRARVLQLDVLRGVAILLVLIHHQVIPSERAGFLRPIADPLFHFGWTGVDLFFVLSGFLIGGLLFKEIARSGRLDVLRFLGRRALKIWPAYFALLAVLFAKLVRHGSSVKAALLSLTPNLVHVQNYTDRLTNQTWSLAVEEHFYLLLPVLLLGFLSFGRSRPAGSLPGFRVACAAYMAVVLLLRMFNAGPTFDFVRHYAATHARMDSLLFGVFLAHISVFSPQLWARWITRRLVLAGIAAATLVPMLLIPKEHVFVYTVGYTLLYLGYGALLMLVVGVARETPVAGRLVHGRVGRALAAIGVLSYSIYLWHVDFVQLPAVHYLGAIAKRMPPSLGYLTCLIVYLAASFAVGFLMNRLIEFPVLRLRDRWFPDRAKVPALSRELNGPTAPIAHCPVPFVA